MERHRQTGRWSEWREVLSERLRGEQRECLCCKADLIANLISQWVLSKANYRMNRYSLNKDTGSSFDPWERVQQQTASSAIMYYWISAWLIYWMNVCFISQIINPNSQTTMKSKCHLVSCFIFSAPSLHLAFSPRSSIIWPLLTLSPDNLSSFLLRVPPNRLSTQW